MTAAPLVLLALSAALLGLAVWRVRGGSARRATTPRGPADADGGDCTDPRLALPSFGPDDETDAAPMRPWAGDPGLPAPRRRPFEPPGRRASGKT